MKIQNEVQKNKNHKLGFTLLELMVVILIIGILAAIALPQYKMAVAKSKYNSIKDMTESLEQSVERYYLANNTFPTDLAVLDIDIPGNYTDSTKKRKKTNTTTCGFNAGSNERQEMICFTNIFGKSIAYLSTVYINQQKHNYCYAFSNDKNDIVNKICQIETGKSFPNSCVSYCKYTY